jgi:Rrf2 family cysteine metabolism transcriptional repressor
MFYGKDASGRDHLTEIRPDNELKGGLPCFRLTEVHRKSYFFTVKLTTQSEYALLALIYLARHHKEGWIPIREIAREQAIPSKFLEQILLRLKRARYLQSLKGKGGGYKLSRPASKILFSEIVRQFDGALAPSGCASKFFYEPSPIEKEKKVLHLLKDIRNYIADKLEHTSLSDVC